MSPLWIALALLLVPALWLISVPLRSAQRVHDDQQAFEANDLGAQQNVAIFRRRLASLEAAKARGEVSDEAFAQDKLTLERSLLEDTALMHRRALASPRSGRLAVPLVMVIMVVASLAWYYVEGAEGDLALLAVQRELQADPEATLPDYLARLEQEAARQPNNPNVWASLFPLYRDSGLSTKALNALNQLIALEGRAPSLLAQLAQLRFFMAGRELTPEVQALIDETQALDPREPTILGLLGLHAFDSGDYELAIDRWRRAVASVNDPDAVASFREGIRVAQEKLDEANANADGNANTPANPDAQE